MPLGAHPRALGLVRLVLLAACGLAACGAGEDPGGSDPARPNILLLTFDTLRADHTGPYGYGRATTPTLDELARSSVVFEQAIVPRGSTRPSYASMLSGLYPYRHGVRSNRRVLHSDVVTLPELLRARGYHTAAFVSNFVLVGEMSGLDQGFDVYDDALSERQDDAAADGVTFANYERSAAATLAAILAWLEDDPPEPYFLFVNLIDPHGPYRPPPAYDGLFQSEATRELDPAVIPAYVREPGVTDLAGYVDRYDAEIRYADDSLAALLDALEERGTLDDSLLVVTADHGEGLGEHNQFFEHHWDVWEETVHVPLLVRLPGAAEGDGRRVEGVVSPLDLTPTILAQLGIPFADDLDGVDLADALAGGEEGGDAAAGGGANGRDVLVEFPDVATPGRRLQGVYAMRGRTHKLVYRVHPDTREVLRRTVYDLARDPLEQAPLPFDAGDAEHARLARALDEALAQVADHERPFVVEEFYLPLEERPAYVEGRASRVEAKTLSPESAAKLEALGYTR